jgi:hypothetical protein
MSKNIILVLIKRFGIWQLIFIGPNLSELILFSSTYSDTYTNVNTYIYIYIYEIMSIEIFFKFLIKMWMCKIQFLAYKILIFTFQVMFIILRLCKLSPRHWSACYYDWNCLYYLFRICCSRKSFLLCVKFVRVEKCVCAETSVSLADSLHKLRLNIELVGYIIVWILFSCSVIMSYCVIILFQLSKNYNFRLWHQNDK